MHGKSEARPQLPRRREARGISTPKSLTRTFHSKRKPSAVDYWQFEMAGPDCLCLSAKAAVSMWGGFRCSETPSCYATGKCLTHASSRLCASNAWLVGILTLSGFESTRGLRGNRNEKD